MLSYDNYYLIFIIAAVLCGVMLLTAVLLFIFLNIPKVIGDLSGATARKAIANIRNQNESTGDKTYRSSHVNKERGRITDKISPSGNILKPQTDVGTGAMATSKLNTDSLIKEATSAINSSNENATTLLSDTEGGAAAETAVLFDNSNSVGNETTLLSNTVPVAAAVPVAAVQFTVEREITFIHTNEIIPVEVM